MSEQHDTGFVHFRECTQEGQCRICGDWSRGAIGNYWDCDDGWKFGRLCGACARYCLAHPPVPTDYAYCAEQAEARIRELGVRS